VAVGIAAKGQGLDLQSRIDNGQIGHPGTQDVVKYRCQRGGRVVAPDVHWPGFMNLWRGASQPGQCQSSGKAANGVPGGMSRVASPSAGS